MEDHLSQPILVVSRWLIWTTNLMRRHDNCKTSIPMSVLISIPCLCVLSHRCCSVAVIQNWWKTWKHGTPWKNNTYLPSRQKFSLVTSLRTVNFRTGSSPTWVGPKIMYPILHGLPWPKNHHKNTHKRPTRKRPPEHHQGTAWIPPQHHQIPRRHNMTQHTETCPPKRGGDTAAQKGLRHPGSAPRHHRHHATDTPPLHQNITDTPISSQFVRDSNWY